MTVTAASSDDSTATTAPSEETASPDAEATETPAEATTLGEFVSLTATKADTLTAVFDSAVPADATVVVENQYGTVSGSSEISDTTITFTGTASFSEDTYTMTVSYGDASKSMSVEVVAEYVASIEILSDEALTGGTKTVDGKEISNYEAYIYYDVYNQYGESLKETTTVTWTISSGDSNSVDKSKGKITVSKNSESWTYGTTIAVVGVYVGSSGKTASVSKTVTVGLAQALDAVEFVGFLNSDDLTTIESSLPNDFAKDKWYLLYTALDQQGNEMDAAEYVGNKKVTFVSDAPLLIDSTSFEEAGVKTVNSVDYAAVTIQPGTYVDKGGEVNITAISTGTGYKTPLNVVIGSNGVLQSLVLQAPSSVIANGDQSVTLDYTATDTNGNDVTNYETIVRSSNTLTLKASEGTITISEDADGKAKITWSDEYQATESSKSDYVFANKTCYDGTDSLVSLTTVVVGGDSNNTMITVSDARIPSAISSYADGANGNGYIVVGDSARLSYKSLTYVDQYNATYAGDSDLMVAFFTYSAANGIDGDYYGIRYSVSTAAMTIDSADAVADTVLYDGSSVSLTAAGSDVATCTMTMYIVKDDTTSTTLAKADSWETVSKSYKYTFTVVPQAKVTGAYIDGLPDSMGIITDGTEYSNGALLEAANDGFSFGNAVSDGYLPTVSWAWSCNVLGTYKGYTVVCPDASETADTEIVVDSWSNSHGTGTWNYLNVSGGAIAWNELYDLNAANYTRKTTTVKMIMDVTGIGTIYKKVTVTDAPAVLTSMGHDTSTVYPTLTKFTLDTSSWYNSQYGEDSIKYDVTAEYTVDTYTEATTSLNKLTGVTISGNGTSTVTVEGAEVGDTFTVTEVATDAWGVELTSTYTITVGPDEMAYIDSEGDGTVATTTATGTKDKGLREVLGYDR